jgi:hypothetical protein
MNAAYDGTVIYGVHGATEEKPTGRTVLPEVHFSGEHLVGYFTISRSMTTDPLTTVSFPWSRV